MESEYWIVRQSDGETVANYLGTEARDALVKFLHDEAPETRDPSYPKPHITQDQHGRRYFAVIEGEQFYADKV